MNDNLNLSSLCRSLAKALSEECSPITDRKLMELFDARAAGDGRGNLESSNVVDVYVTPAVVFAAYADWITDVGVELGFACQDDESAGEWIRDDMRETRSIAKAIRKMTVSGMASLDDKLKEAIGFSASDAFLQSINTGEPIEQSHARLHARHRGLKPVKPKS